MYALIDIFNIYLLEFLIIMEKLQDVLKEKFDICYVLNLSDRKIAEIIWKHNLRK